MTKAIIPKIRRLAKAMRQSDSVSFIEGQNVFIEGKDYDKKRLKDFEKYKTVWARSCTEKEKEGTFHLALCGFMVIKDQPIIIFPKNFPIKQVAQDGKEYPRDRIVGAARLLFRTFALYRTRRDKSRGWKARDAEMGLEDREENAITGVNEILYVLEDFKRNGYLNRRHTVISQTKPGRIVWNRTIHKTTPIISHRQPFYANPYMKSNVRHDEEMVQKIHRYLVGKFCKAWGWLIGDVKAEEYPAPCTSKEAIIILSAELQSCFVQREIDLIRSMIRYFKEKRGDKEEQREEYMLTPEFEQIWENVCGDIISNCYDFYQKKIPKAKFFPESVSAKPKKWIQKPDILSKKDGKLYILDAKYYAFRLPDSDDLDEEGGAAWKAHFPGWGDMVKQFVYRYTIEKNITAFGATEVTANALLFPGGHTEKGPFHYHGTARIPETKDFGGIQLWSLDIEEMLKAYTDTDAQKRKTIRNEFLDALQEIANKEAWEKAADLP